MKWRKFLSLLGVLAMIFCLCAPAFAEFNTTAARKGVAAVYTCFELTDGQEVGFGSGTCFFIGERGENPSYLITNNHVIETWKTYGEGQLISIPVDAQNSLSGRAKIRVYYDAKNYVEAYHVASDEIKDVAILRLDAPSTDREAMPIQIPTEDMVATPVHAIGYPGIAENVLVAPTTKWGLNDSSVDSGTISRLGTTAGTGRSIVQLDFSIRHGNSGGPLVNDQGYVLGITAMGVSNSQSGESVDYAINIQEAVSMINREGIRAEIIDASAPPATEALVPPPITPTVTPRPDFPVGPVAGSVVAIAVVGGGAVFLLRRKKSGGGGTASAKRPALISMSPQHNGMMLSLENRQIVAGRRGCDIAFQDGTPGVSGKHCSVYWDSNSKDFVVTDLQSSFGTYLQNGQRLTPNMATHLKAGDSFYLGEPSNMLRVDLI